MALFLPCGRRGANIRTSQAHRKLLIEGYCDDAELVLTTVPRRATRGDVFWFDAENLQSVVIDVLCDGVG
jgi:hypothetical protein